MADWNNQGICDAGYDSVAAFDEEILIKPHHFMDIVKLYGGGVHHFVPDEAFQHDFYRVANRIVENPDQCLRMTIAGDDICKPCNRFDGTRCTDRLTWWAGIVKKNSTIGSLTAGLSGSFGWMSMSFIPQGIF